MRRINSYSSSEYVPARRMETGASFVIAGRLQPARTAAPAAPKTNSRRVRYTLADKKIPPLAGGFRKCGDGKRDRAVMLHHRTGRGRAPMGEQPQNQPACR